MACKLFAKSYGLDPLLVLRKSFGAAFAPPFNDQGVMLSKGGLRNGKGPYWPMAGSQFLIMDCMHLLCECARETTSIAELCTKFYQRAVDPYLKNAALTRLILVFEPELPSAETACAGALKRLNAARNDTSIKMSATMLESLVRSPIHYERAMGALLDYLLEKAPLRPGVRLIISGLTHFRATPQTNGCRMPACVRYDVGNNIPEAGVARIVSPLAAPDSDARIVPRDATQWFTAGYSVTDQLKFWLLFALERATPIGEQIIAVHSESSQALVELMCIYDAYLCDPADGNKNPMDVLFVRTTMIAGYHPKKNGARAELNSSASAINPNEPLDKNRPHYLPEQVDIGHLVRLMGATMGAEFEKLGMRATTAFMFALWLREHDMHPAPLLKNVSASQTCNVYGLWMQMLEHAQAIPNQAQGGKSNHILSTVDQTNVRVNFAPLCAIMWLLDPSLADQDRRIALPQLRAHAARLSYWYYLLFNSHRPGAARIDPCAKTAVSLYGYEMLVDASKDKDARRCEPLSAMTDGDQRLSYAVEFIK